MHKYTEKFDEKFKLYLKSIATNGIISIEIGEINVATMETEIKIKVKIDGEVVYEVDPLHMQSGSSFDIAGLTIDLGKLGK